MFIVIRTGTGQDGTGEKLVAQRRTRPVAEEVVRVFQRASDAKGEHYHYEVREA